MDFELGRSSAELSGAQRSSAEPEPSSAEHFPIAHFWVQPKGVLARTGTPKIHLFEHFFLRLHTGRKNSKLSKGELALSPCVVQKHG